jgi:hypothetical protein
MKKSGLNFWIVAALAGCVFLTSAHAGEGAQVSVPRFCMIHVNVDPKGQPLAAYQVEITFTNPAVRIVGIEGGDRAPYTNAPHYDPKAIQHERVILAAFSLSPETRLPTNKVRVASVHLMVGGGGSPGQPGIRVIAAASSRGKTISVEATTEPGKQHEDSP